MATTLDAIETALFAALDTKRQTGGAALTTTRPFRAVARWSAEGRPEDVAEAAAGTCPSALLVYLGSDAITGRGGAGSGDGVRAHAGRRSLGLPPNETQER